MKPSSKRDLIKTLCSGRRNVQYRSRLIVCLMARRRLAGHALIVPPAGFEPASSITATGVETRTGTRACDHYASESGVLEAILWYMLGYMPRSLYPVTGVGGKAEDFFTCHDCRRPKTREHMHMIGLLNVCRKCAERYSLCVRQ